MLRVSPEAVAEDPRPDDAAAMIEELSLLLSGLDRLQRSIIELSMQDQTVEQISSAVQRSERTVRRTLQSVREQLENRLLTSVGPSQADD